MTTPLTRHDVLAEEKQQPYFINTLSTVAAERQAGQTIYPPQKDVFNAFRYTELSDVKVVILGAGSVPRPRAGSRTGIFRASGRGHPPFSAEYVQRAGRNDSGFHPP